MDRCDHTAPTRRCRVHRPALAREHRGDYAPGTRPVPQEPGLPDDSLGPSLRDAASRLREDASLLLERAVDPSRAAHGELGGLLDLLAAIDTAQACAVELADQVLRDQTAERSTGLTLESLLAMRSGLTFGDRRTLTFLAELLRGMPRLKAAFQAGVLGFAALRTVASEAKALSAEQRRELDAGFADHDRLAAMDPDQQVDAVAREVARLRPRLAENRELRRIERRFLRLTPALDGALSLYGELDPEAGATVLNALEAAAAPPTAERDVTRGAMNAADGPDHAASGVSPDGEHRDMSDDEDDDHGRPAARTRARQHADALTLLAETFLGGRRAEGTTRRARPRMLVWTEIETLTGHDEVGEAARLLWNAVGAPVALTPGAARRLASDAQLQFVVHDDGQVLAVSEPTPTIPERIRAAVIARDQGCRFPGCTAPIDWCDLHHVVARHLGGPTVVDNLVAVCRRHHTAVTQGRWQLAMSPDGRVTVRRGRHAAASDPPHRRTLRDRSRPPRAGPAGRPGPRINADRTRRAAAAAPAAPP